jgi:16S rRNA (cytidine1402-2'-O)-methyltransferase
MANPHQVMTDTATTRSTLGRLILMPNTLDLGCVPEGEAPPDLREVLPDAVIRQAAQMQHWVVENAKSARAFLKRVDAIHPLAQPLQAIDIQVMPRPTKGAPAASKGGTPDTRQQDAEWAALLRPALQGQDMGLLSEAGLPAVADPGALLVRQAHAQGIGVLPLSGPSSLMLALASSGLHGQSFSFVGYLPTDAVQRASQIKQLEQASRKLQQTQLAIETPYRNQALFDALIQHLQPDTRLNIACGLTLPQGWSRTLAVSAWRKAGLSLPGDVPAVFSWLAA